MSTPTYATAKCLNKIISPYVPTTYSLTSTADFIDIISAANPQGEIASLDVDNLFTNVPLEETIDILMDMVYRSDKTPLPIHENILRDLLNPRTLTFKPSYTISKSGFF